jgi:hypothetical protein
MVGGEADKPLLEGGYYPGAREETALNFPPVKVDSFESLLSSSLTDFPPQS